MPTYKDLPIVNKWQTLYNRIESEVENWVKRARNRKPDQYDDDLCSGMFTPAPEAKDAPLYDVKWKMDDLNRQENNEKWIIDQIMRICDNDVDAACYVNICINKGEAHYPDGGARITTKATIQEVTDRTIEIILARYKYKQLTGGGE